MLNFANGDTEFPLPSSAARAWSAREVPEVKMKKKKNFDKRIVAMPLPKQGYKIFFSNCGNGIAENGGKKSYEIYERVKKKVVMSTIFLQHFYNKSHMISYY